MNAESSTSSESAETALNPLNDPVLDGARGRLVELLDFDGWSDRCEAAAIAYAQRIIELGSLSEQQAIGSLREAGVSDDLAGPIVRRAMSAPEHPPTSPVYPAIGPRDYEALPWYRKSGVNSGLIVATLLTFGLFPGTLIVCINALTGEIYYRKKDDMGYLKRWHWGNKLVAVFILAINALFLLLIIGG